MGQVVKVFGMRLRTDIIELLEKERDIFVVSVVPELSLFFVTCAGRRTFFRRLFHRPEAAKNVGRHI